jgi:DNA (cytosine-5)-methyltransferase 1
VWSQIPKVDYPKILEDHWKLHLAERLPNAPTVISTFAGCGGSSLGYSMAGFKELLAVEWDDNAVATFKLNFPGIPVYHGDIAKVSVEEVLKLTGLQPGQLDILDGSPPCQGFSTAGKRCMDDDRNQLFREYVRLLRGLQPKVFVMENVSGMVKGKMKLIFVEILKELKASGYEVSARLLNAMYFNVPQSRERLFFVGIRPDLDKKPSHPMVQSKIITLRDAIQDLPKTQDESTDHVWIDEWAHKTRWIEKVPFVKPGRSLRPDGHQIRLEWDKPSPTLIRNGGARCYVANSNIHPTEHRTLSIREMARIASFPDKYKFVDARKNGHNRIGNCVPPLFMYAIAKHIKDKILS